MKTAVALSAVLGMLSSASAHYTFDKLVVNGVQQGGDNTYVRKHQNGYMPTKFKNIPSGSISPTDADFTCNKQSTPAAQVYKVKAGDKVALKQAFGGTGMKHPGPTQFYFSPVADAKSGTGSEWYKVSQSLLCTAGGPETLRSDAWCSYGEDNVSFVVPATVPDGQYLVRGEHIALHGAHDGQAEFYYACAQLEVTGNSAAASMPGTGVKIPGVYKQADASVNFSVWGKSTAYDLTPGPDVIPGGTIRGSASGAGGDKTTTVGGGSSSSNGTSAQSAKPSSAVSAESAGNCKCQN
ncbi:putative endo-beta-1,4-glucanase D [Colletotrichum orbiculare MAFF 240422]|uniref:lytic cellulose monooxygenase (C4-dehydrogenating) n=1 Tax=Colletotrichum orbiculare (strain 104-T / ATCC 96160 / CBS 514.97 / LARS 414 / MAFF 240422) TaxID=1213857 RepID=N4VE34_COLOR|nr:putative endo-beta-1,4-glucanase D [Colletotrichum orbiculare MAFF 240422]